jgi:hypothetical protein
MNVASRDEIIETRGRVDSLSDFFEWVKSWTKARLKNKTFILEIQQKIEWQDPIEYLDDLYYNHKKSLKEIIKTLEEKWVKIISNATLHRLLFIHFWWIPRENTERTPVHEKQLHQKVTWEIADFESKVSLLIGWREVPRAFKIEEYEKKRYRMGKALYVLKTLGRVDKNILYYLSIEWGLSNAVLATSLNEELKKVLRDNPEFWIDFESIELYPQSIRRWFKYNSEKLKIA